jgi:predicted ester cyclase
MGQLRTMVETHYRGVSEGDLDLAASVFTPDVVSIDPGAGRMEGIDAFRGYGETFLRAFPDGRLRADRIVAETDSSIVVEGTFSGTHTGPLAGPDGEIPPTGRRLALPFVDVFDARDGRFVEHHIYYDQMALLGQLGLVPAPG